MTRMKVLIGYDRSSYADAAIDDLRRAGLPREVEAFVVSVGEAPIIPPLASYDIIEKAVVGERVISIVNHANTHISLAIVSTRDQAFAASGQLESYFPSWKVRAAAVGGRPATELIQEAREWTAHLIVVGSQGRSAVGRLFLGSVSLEVAIGAPCSVRIGRRQFRKNPQAPTRIIVGLAGLA